MAAAPGAQVYASSALSLIYSNTAKAAMHEIPWNAKPTLSSESVISADTLRPQNRQRVGNIPGNPAAREVRQRQHWKPCGMENPPTPTVKILRRGKSANANTGIRKSPTPTVKFYGTENPPTSTVKILRREKSRCEILRHGKSANANYKFCGTKHPASGGPTRTPENYAARFSRLGCADDAIAIFKRTLDGGPRRSLRRGPPGGVVCERKMERVAPRTDQFRSTSIVPIIL